MNLDELKERRRLEREERRASEPKRKYRPAGKGLTQAFFFTNADFDDGYMEEIGTQTKHIDIDDGWFSDKYINDLLYLGIGENNVCKNLETLSVKWGRNDPLDLEDNDATSEAMIAFAQACPNLTTVKIQNIYPGCVSDEVLLAFFNSCPRLKHFELLSHCWNNVAGNDIAGEALDALAENPGLCSKLKDLILDDTSDPDSLFMKSMKNLSRARHPRLKIKLTSIRDLGGRSEDWQWCPEVYKNGRKQDNY